MNTIERNEIIRNVSAQAAQYRSQAEHTTGNIRKFNEMMARKFEVHAATLRMMQ